MAFELSRFTLLGKKIVGAGINYRSVLKERQLPAPSSPVIFLKPTSSYITEGHPIQEFGFLAEHFPSALVRKCFLEKLKPRKLRFIEIPPGFEVHHEVELGVIMGSRCREVRPEAVLDHIAGYCLALDLTAVDQMKEARTKGLPWTLGKGFDTACPVSCPLEKSAVEDMNQLTLWLEVNGRRCQECSTADMVFPPARLISFISQYMTLEPYDLILTGSPAGTGPLHSRDIVSAGLGDLVHVQFHVK